MALIPGLSWLTIGAGAIAASAVWYGILTVDVDRLEAKQAKALTEQAQALTEACEKDKLITKGANDALQKQNDIIAGKLAVAKRVRLANCIVPKPASGTVTAASGGEYAGQNGVSTDWLFDFAAECETYRQQRITLEKFISDERQDAPSPP